MAKAPCSTDLRIRPLPPIRASQGEWPGDVRPNEGRAAANPFRQRFDRVTVGASLVALICLLSERAPAAPPSARLVDRVFDQEAERPLKGNSAGECR